MSQKEVFKVRVPFQVGKRKDEAKGATISKLFHPSKITVLEESISSDFDGTSFLAQGTLPERLEHGELTYFKMQDSQEHNSWTYVTLQGKFSELKLATSPVEESTKKEKEGATNKITTKIEKIEKEIEETKEEIKKTKEEIAEKETTLQNLRAQEKEGPGSFKNEIEDTIASLTTLRASLTNLQASLLNQELSLGTLFSKLPGLESEIAGAKTKTDPIEALVEKMPAASQFADLKSPMNAHWSKWTDAGTGKNCLYQFHRLPGAPGGLLHASASSPALAKLIADVRSTSPIVIDQQTRKEIMTLTKAAAASYPDEKARKSAMCKALVPALGPLRNTNSDRSQNSDGGVIADVEMEISTGYNPNSKSPVTIRPAGLEFKNEPGSTGYDPHAQNAAYTIQFFGNEQQKILRQKTACPSLTLEFDGPNLTVTACCFDGKSFKFDHIISLPFLEYSDDYYLTCQQTRVWIALKACIASLKQEYTDALSPKLLPFTQGFPNVHEINKYPPGNGKITWEYLEEMKTRIFKAKLTSSGELVVVKLCKRSFDPRAQDLLHKNGLAPKILGLGENGFWTVVVMQYIEDADDWDRLEHLKSLGDAGDWDRLTEKHSESLDRALTLLKSHKPPLVHGDLRGPNILLKGDQLDIIDFEYSGEAGVATYPVDLNVDLQAFIEGKAVPSRPITYENDQLMVAYLKQRDY